MRVRPLEKRRREQERRRALEGTRLEFLQLQMDRHDETVRVENLVTSYPPEGRSDEKVAAPLDWAADRARRLRRNSHRPGFAQSSTEMT